MDELISVIIPCYNAEDTIDRSIESVIEQTYHRWELIIVDDGSSDNSMQRINFWSTQDTRIIVCSQKNAGVSAARNKAIRMSSGEYLAFLDADDWYESDFLEELYRALKEKNADIACSAYRIENERMGHDVLAKKKKNVFKGKECIQQFLFENSVRGFVWNKLFKSSAICKVEFRNDLKLCEDMYFLCEAYSQNWVMAYLNRALYHYWINGTGATQSDKILISQFGGIQELDIYEMIKKLFCDGSTKKYFVELSGNTIINTFKENNAIHKYKKQEIKNQISKIWIQYLFTKASIKNKMKFYLTLLRIGGVWRHIK